MSFSLLYVCISLPQHASELRFDGFSLRTSDHQVLGSSLFLGPYITTDHKLQPEVSPEPSSIYNFFISLLNLTLHTETKYDYRLML